MFDESLKTFEMLSLSHGLAVLVVFLLIAGILIFKNNLSNRQKLDKVLRISVACTMLGLQLIFDGWRIAQGGVKWFDFLPLGVCHIAMLTTSVCLLLNNEKLFRFIFPWAVGGALLSLVIADLEYEFPHFRYFHYFGNHGLFLIANVYLVVIRKWSLRYKNILISSLALFVFAISMIFVNQWMGTNLLFMNELPEPGQPLFAWMGEPWWRAGFIFAIFVLFHVTYGIYRVLHHVAIAEKKRAD